MSKERDELEAIHVEAQRKVCAADTVEGYEAACCVADDTLDALTEFDQKRLREISDATHNGTVGDCHAALKEAGIIQ